jgi:hypothetical protein
MLVLERLHATRASGRAPRVEDTQKYRDEQRTRMSALASVQTFVGGGTARSELRFSSSAFQTPQTIAESNECVAKDNFSTKLMAGCSMPARHRTGQSRP